ncbi:hypothetical protein ACKS0A_09857 [Histoplasma ohiense]
MNLDIDNVNFLRLKMISRGWHNNLPHRQLSPSIGLDKPHQRSQDPSRPKYAARSRVTVASFDPTLIALTVRCFL